MCNRSNSLIVPHRWALTLLSTTVLAACNGTFTGDLATDPPSDPAIAEINVTLRGLEFQKSGSTERLEFTEGEPVDLMEFVDGTPLRIFTDEQLSEGTYTGVRLLLDADAEVTVVDTAGGEFEGTLSEGEFAPLSFTVEDNDRSRESYALVIDLRRSLVFDAATDAYTLTPVLRTVPTADAASVGGNVDIDCERGTALADGGAVYIFAGRDIVPDDIDGNEVEPYATTRIQAPQTGIFATYTLRFLAPGPYTLAATCRGHQDALDGDDDLQFQRIRSVTLKDGDTLDVDLD